MILCDKNCKPCCDFCIHVIYFHEGPIKLNPIGCSRHKDKEHQEIAESSGWCDDFHCYNVKPENLKI